MGQHYLTSGVPRHGNNRDEWISPHKFHQGSPFTGYNPPLLGLQSFTNNAPSKEDVKDRGILHPKISGVPPNRM